MPVKLARQGGALLQHINTSDVFSRPVRQMISHAHIQRISMLSSGRSAGLLSARISILSRSLTNTYATAAKAKESESKVRKVKSRVAKEKQEPESEQETTKPKRGRPKKELVDGKPKELTPKQQEAQNARDKRQEILQLKEKALTLPDLNPVNWGSVARKALAEIAMKEKPELRRGGPSLLNELMERVRVLPEEEIERYKKTALENKDKNEEVMNKWIQSYTPAQIRDANAARHKLHKLEKKRSRLRLINDPRLVSRPAPPYVIFSRIRTEEDPELKNLPFVERSRAIAAQWKELASEEKKAYYQTFEEDKERYQREYKEVYGEKPASKA
ncbi:uncharacterized protein BP01DRAFT_391039 [Aspergillus saccharolyticus JOP 1030-1]|uniref:HMG box domain-containing protein n=1 Tax=Aspergillus saccharolyticus JOP 1030-1 TaxID=1450539 RepID=A0A319A1M8_9EURO|nr:hypothetical protein BP01DRAFT_391039 [Aspergillus saccharolyticus JOP 1030-1]PYH46198.1 hypothetical protein BP01DRAFT_391039 [Aspergillus saccharolyticus JOP 1030-1]